MALNQKEKRMIAELEQKGFTIIQPDRYKCQKCGKERSLKESSNWYSANNDMLLKNTPVIPICRKCMADLWNQLVIDAKGNEKQGTYNFMQELRIPWNETLWEIASTSTRGTVWGLYIAKYNSLPQYSKLTMNDSEILEGGIETFSEDKSSEGLMKKKDKKEALLRWGSNWDEIELMRLEQFYHNMKSANKIETPQDEDYLKKLSRLSVKIDVAIENDESGKAKQLGDLYSKYMTDSKFRAMDMTDADKQGGIRTFSQIYAEVESDDFIPPWEKYSKLLKVGQDIIDKTIMHIENFTLRFNNAERMIMPPSDTPKEKIDEEKEVGDEYV